MQILPTIWAGSLSVGLSILALMLVVIFITAAKHRVVRLISGIAAAFVSLVVLSSGIDSVIIHDERALLVFTAIAVGAGTLVFLVVKLAMKAISR
jgi:hypothetical protein